MKGKKDRERDGVQREIEKRVLLGRSSNKAREKNIKGKTERKRDRQRNRKVERRMIWLD